MIKPTDPRMKDVNVQEALSAEVRMLARLFQENYNPKSPVFINAVKGFHGHLDMITKNLEENVHTSSVIGLGIREQVKMQIALLRPLTSLLNATFMSEDVRQEVLQHCSSLIDLVLEAKGNIVRAK